MGMLPDWVSDSLDFMATVFVIVIGLAVLAVVVMFVIDVTQSRNTIRRNYPVIGRFRSLFTELGEFFRQYFFALDREELPFNRSERDWVYGAADDRNNTKGFGSTRHMGVAGTPIFANGAFAPLEEEVEPPSTLRIGPYARRPYDAPSFFNISGMSYGAISRPAVRALSRGAKKAGCWMNTGEGGLSPYHVEGGCDIVFQIGTAKYGVRTDDGRLHDDKLRRLVENQQVRMIEVKLSQGAKPGKGGILPGGKVNAEIAEIRGIEEGQDSISPNRHPDIGNVAELLDFIDHVRGITGLPVGIKAVIGETTWLDDLACEIKRRGIESAPDFFTLDSGDGGTGAAPMALIDNVGMTLRETLPLLVDTLVEHGLRERIRVVCSGKLITPASIAWALCVGADFVTSARGFLFSLGCIQAQKCNTNTCPTGITTQNKRLQRGLVPREKGPRVTAYHAHVVHEVELIAHACGVKEPRALTRDHVRIVQDNGRSVPLSQLHPLPGETAAEAA